ncbi:MAG: FAD-dependent oxidoreductase [Planctomycetes bacterium]|nr:FAD-dependent oxidoreductase [Planctomycetota bacterium]
MEYNIATKRFIGDDRGRVRAVETVRVEWSTPPAGGSPISNEVPNSKEVWDAHLVLLAMGFLGPDTKTLVDQLGIELTIRGNIDSDANTKMTSAPGVFAAGDCRRGQSLIVWAIAEGREVAACIDTHLRGEPTILPRVRLSPYRY